MSNPWQKKPINLEEFLKNANATKPIVSFWLSNHREHMLICLPHFQL